MCRYLRRRNPQPALALPLTYGSHRLTNELASSVPLMEGHRTPVWRILGATARGASHRRNGLPNQDAISWRTASGLNQPAVLAVADGHGGPLYVRSQRGSRLATHVAVSTLLQFAAVHSGPARLSARPELSAVKRVAADRLPRDLVLAWSEAVAADLLKEPLSASELADVERRVSPSAVERLQANPVLAYGSTLLALLITQDYMLAVQLGDGDILAVADDREPSGRVTDWPLLRDPHLIANETTSLCNPKAWRHVRTYLMPTVTVTPQLLLLATDGYANSFEDRDGLLRAAQDLLAAIRDEGLPAVSRQLPAWLRATSVAGSGDDITVGLAYRLPET